MIAGSLKPSGLYQVQWPAPPTNQDDFKRWEQEFEWALRAFVDRLNTDRAALEARLKKVEAEIASLTPPATS